MEDHLQVLSTLGLPLIPADFELEEPGSIRIEKRDDFLHAVRLSGAALVFTMQRELGAWDFEAGDGMDMQEEVALAAYRPRIGEVASLYALVVVGGLRLEWSVGAPWWPEFVVACETAREQRRAQHQTQRQTREAAIIQAARKRLPQDPAFMALACETRPRITALRLRAGAVLQEVGPIVGGSVDRAIREIAAQVKAAQRPRRGHSASEQPERHRNHQQQVQDDHPHEDGQQASTSP